MNARFILTALLLSVLGAADAQAQSTPRAGDAAPTAPYAVTGMPDACKLLPQSDLEALFPGRPITKKEATLSPIFKGPQYVETCMYIVKLPSPTSSSDTSKFASTHIISWGTQSKNPKELARDFAYSRDTAEKIAENAKYKKRVEPLKGVGDDASAW